MGTSQLHISVARLRRLMRLVGEAYDLAANPAEQQRHLLGGLLQVVGGVAVMRAQIYDYAPGGGFDARHAVSIGLEEGYRRRLAESQTHQVAINPAIERIMKRHDERAIDGVATALRSETIRDRDWYGSGFVAELRRPARIDDHIHTARLVGAKHADLVGVARGWGDPPFGEEERDLVHLFHTDVLSRFGLPGAASASPRLPALFEGDLSPRERSTLALLLTGASEKRIATRLGISPHTTHDYVKAIYRKIGAKSRAELMARVLAAR